MVTGDVPNVGMCLAIRDGKMVLVKWSTMAMTKEAEEFAAFQRDKP